MPNNLPKYLDEPVRELAKRHEVSLREEECERHRIYCYLLMAITAHYWNGNKYGTNWEYPLNRFAKEGGCGERGGYVGHNIAALAVAGDGEIIDFEFNHNEIYNSSVEHAESRMLRRVFALRQISDSWDVDGQCNPDKDYGTLLSKVTVYTTLESCTQCSGVMTLAGVKEVVYLQTDPQMYNIGDILRRLSRQDGDQTYLQAPLPIAAAHVGLKAFAELDKRYASFKAAQGAKEGLPFRRRRDKAGEWDSRYSGSITSFLCTEQAFEVFNTGISELRRLEKIYTEGEGCGDFCPADSRWQNARLLKEALDFYDYAITKGSRATAHKV